MAQVAVVQRHLFFPDRLPQTRYLTKNTPTPIEEDWSAERRAAVEFISHGAADDVAEQIRKHGIAHVHAAVCEKPIALRPLVDPIDREFAKTEPRPVSTSLAVAKRVEAAEGPARDANKPLMRKRTASEPSPTGSTASDTFRRSKKRDRANALREAQKRVTASTESPNEKFWWREGQFA